MLGLEANDSLTFFQNEIVPFSNATVSLHFTNRVVVLITEANLIDPILACFQSYLSNWSIRRQMTNLVAFADARVSSEGRCQAATR